MEETFYANCSCEDPIRTEPGKWQHEDGPVRVLRGGSWGNTLSSAARCFSDRGYAFGFRLVAGRDRVRQRARPEGG